MAPKKDVAIARTRWQYMFGQGDSIGEYVALAWRTAENIGLSQWEMESYVVRSSSVAQESVIGRGIVGWTTGLWRSKKGRVYACDGDGTLAIWDRYPRPEDEDPDAWRTMEVPAALNGIWGLDDKHVYMWGGGPDAEHLFLFDGKKIAEMPSPGPLIALHGAAPDRLWGVGEEGLIAAWNGRTWKKFASGTRDNMVSVFAAGPDEVYAVAYRGKVYEGTSRGWTLRAKGVGVAHCVVKWRDDVWIAAGAKGLHRLVPRKNDLECVKPKLDCTWLDGRGFLLATCPDRIGHTENGVDFRVFRDTLFADLVSKRRPGWMEETG